MRCLLVDLAAVGVVTQVHGRLPGGAGGVHTQRTPALLTLPPTRSLNRNKFRIRFDSRLRVKVLRFKVRQVQKLVKEMMQLNMKFEPQMI